MISSHTPLSGDSSGGPEGPQGGEPGLRLVPVEQLSREGTRFVRLLDPERVAAVVGDAVQGALARCPAVDDPQRQDVARAAQAEVGRLLQSDRQEQARGLQAAAEPAKLAPEEALERDVERLRLAVERAQRRLEQERDGEPAPGRLHFSDAALEGLGRELRQLVERLGPPEGDPLGWRQGVEALGQALSRATSRALEAERERLRREHRRCRDARVARCEQRIDTLQRALRERSRQLLQRRRVVRDDPWADSGDGISTTATGSDETGRPKRAAG